MANLLLSARDAGVRRGRRDIMTHISLVATAGEFIAVLGPSGSGKSTLIKSLLGLVRLSSGHVLLNGAPVAPQAWQGSLGYVPQDDIVHRALRVDQALSFAAELRLPPGETTPKIERVLRRLGLWEQRKQRIRTLSGGQRKRVSIAMELLSDPELLVLDEPTSGLDPGLEASLMRQLAMLAQQGLLVMATTHTMVNLHLASRVWLVCGGRLVYDGPPHALAGYFGVETPEAVFPVLTKRSPAEWATDFHRRGRRFGVES